MAQKKGEYRDSTCQTKSSKPKRGSFEKEGGPGYTSTIRQLTLETPGLGSGELVCAAGTAKGEITGVRAGVERITLTGCEMAGRQCASAGPDSTPSSTPGVVVTNLLATRLVGPEPGGAWTELTSAEHEPYLFEFDCEGPLFRTTGSLTGVQGGNVNVQSLSSTTTFAIGEGEQALDTELSENGGASWSGPEHSSAVGVAENTAAEATEIKPTFWSSLE